jgi:hypothetical protein
VTGKLRKALELMVYSGMSFDKAAQAVQLTTRAMRLALERPHVIRYLKEQKQVFRASVSSQNIFKLADIRDNSDNAMAQLGAIKVLEQIDNDTASNQRQSMPGFVILVAGSNVETKQINTIDAINHTSQINDDDSSK